MIIVDEKVQQICEDLLSIASEINDDLITDELFYISDRIKVIVKGVTDEQEKEAGS